MAKARSILKRSKAVKSTRTITRTMEMISTARFKKTHDRVVAARPYNERINGIVSELIHGSKGADVHHPLLEPKEQVKTHVLLVITANRGLCGSYNSSIIRMAVERHQQITAAGDTVRVLVVGKRGLQILKFRGYEIAKSFTQFDYLPQYRDAADLAQGLMDEFVDGQIAGLEIAYMQFISAGRQKPAIAQVLPLSLEAPASPLQHPDGLRPTYEFLPSPAQVLGELLPAAVRLHVYQCFLDAAVSEQMARMTSMRSATENADEMIHTLTVRYNRMRQSQITTELAEIMGGRAGMEE